MLLKSDDNILNWMVENYLPKRNEYIGILNYSSYSVISKY